MRQSRDHGIQHQWAAVKSEELVHEAALLFGRDASMAGCHESACLQHDFGDPVPCMQSVSDVKKQLLVELNRRFIHRKLLRNLANPT
jgi:hypothetical protein